MSPITKPKGGSDLVIEIPPFDSSSLPSALPMAVFDGKVLIAKRDLETMGFVVSDPANLAALRATGISMEPSIRPGDVVVIDRGIRSFNGQGVYLFVLDGHFQLQRLIELPEGGMYIMPDNPFFPRRRIMGQAITIHGKVLPVWEVPR